MIKTKVKVANYSELPERVGVSIRVGDEDIALFRLSSGEVKAVEDKSPHPKGGVLSEGLVSGEFVYCPIYDIKISLNTGKVQEPDVGNVKTYDVEVNADNVYIVI